MDYYIILEIKSGASKNEIKEAYRKMAQKYHPDHYGEDSSAFLKIQEAYQVLSNPVQRKKYDETLLKAKSYAPSIKRKRQRSSEPEPLIPENKFIHPEPISISHSFETYSPSFDEIFNRWFNIFDVGSKSKRAENMNIEVVISSHEAEAGGSLQLMLPVKIACPLCHGSGFVGFWDCQRCASTGIIKTEITLIVTFPAGIRDTYKKFFSLDRFGIQNFYLIVNIRVSDEVY